MHVFKDNTGRDWTVAIHGESIERVKSATGVDLLNHEHILGRLLTESLLLVKVLWELCREAAEPQGLDYAKFSALMTGDAIDRATAAVVEDLIDFFPSARRAAMRKAWQKVIEGQRIVIERVEDELDQLEPSKLLSSASSSGSGPVSAASTPAG